MLKEKLTFVGQFGATDLAFSSGQAPIPRLKTVRLKHLGFVGVILGISRTR